MKLSSGLSEYLRKISDDIRAVVAQDLVGLYLHGSIVQDDFRPGTSDIDVLGVVSGALSDSQRSDLASRVVQHEPPDRAAELELILCPASACSKPILEFPFEFALSTGAGAHAGSEPPGTARDLLIDVSQCRQQGQRLFGPPPYEVLGPVPLGLLRKALFAEMHWHLGDIAGGSATSLTNAVLNAARSHHAARTGEIVSKSEGGRLWLERAPSDGMVADALSHRTRGEAAVLDQKQVHDFVSRTAAAIEELRSEDHIT
ncbi:aminoglycoside adenylyltransferase domain-containing protein [Erythrobacter sp. GH1-10]|uniref:aminoglycoside adenylyltransferase domain-containing protein n=1 Tax=Erythrobacter sp. GH1-10 TaxID=3349334 RepID=UPI003877B01E